MDIEVFKKIIDDLAEFPEPIKSLRLYKEGEALLNPKLPEMIRYAKDSGRVLKIDLTTNGLLLTDNVSKSIVDAGLDWINISVNDIESKRLISYISNLWKHKKQCEVYVKAISENVKDKTTFFINFGDKCDKIFLEHLQPNWPEFEFTDREFTIGHYGQTPEERQVCPFIFYQMVINSDGTVSSCVQDWKHTLLFGNVMKKSVCDIWAFIDRLRYVHLEFGRKTLPFCKDCKVMTYGCLDNIDAYASELLERLL
jgi:radical SAM protein with 4Fe4S-binding SPASM domain